MPQTNMSHSTMSNGSLVSGSGVAGVPVLEPEVGSVGRRCDDFVATAVVEVVYKLKLQSATNCFGTVT